MSDVIGTIIGMVLTLFVFSYIIGENFLYRLAIYIFAGLTAGFVSVIIYDSVLEPWIREMLLSGNVVGIVLGAIPVALALILTLPAAWFGGFRKIALAIIIGVGAATALVGAITGTLIPFFLSTGEAFVQNIFLGMITLVGVTTTLISFSYFARKGDDNRVRRNPFVVIFGAIGRFYVAVALGTLYAAALVTAMTVFSERIIFLLDSFTSLFFGG